MRIRTIDYDNSTPIDDVFFGYMGEHNETALRIVPPESMLDNTAIVSFVIALSSGGRVYHSAATTREAAIETGYVETLLFKDVTGYEELEIQLEAYDNNRSLLAKTEVVYGYIEVSVDGEDAIADEDAGIIADIAANSAARHTHTNKEVLDRITDLGLPLFEKTVEYDSTMFFAGQVISSGTEFAIDEDITAEGKPLYNGRITDIQLYVDENWISIWALTAKSATAQEAAVPTIFTKPFVEDGITVVGAVNIDITDDYYPNAIKIKYITITEVNTEVNND